MASDEGHRLANKWKRLGKALKHAIHMVPRGVHINNQRLKHIAETRGKPVFEHEKRLWTGQGAYGRQFKEAGAAVANSDSFHVMDAAGKRMVKTQGEEVFEAFKHFKNALD